MNALYQSLKFMPIIKRYSISIIVLLCCFQKYEHHFTIPRKIVVPGRRTFLMSQSVIANALHAFEAVRYHSTAPDINALESILQQLEFMNSEKDP